MFRVFRKGKGPEDPKLQLWIKWFTTEPPKSSSILNQYPLLQEFYDKIPYKSLSKQQIKECPEDNQEEYFIDLFELNKEFSPILNDLPQVYSFCMSPDVKSEKILQLFMPFMFRTFIKISYRFAKIFHEAFKGDEKMQILLNMITNVIPIAFSLPKEFAADSFFLFNNVLSVMIELFERKSPLILTYFNSNYLSRVLHICIDFIKNTKDFEQYHFNVYHYSVQYYNFWAENYMNDCFGNLQMHDLQISLNTLVASGKNDLINKYVSQLLTVVEKSLILLSFVFLHTSTKIDQEKCFSLGKTILGFIKFMISLGPEVESRIWSNDSSQFLIVFIGWTINISPIIEELPTFSSDPIEFEFIEDYAKLKEKTICAPSFTFIEEKTFQLPIFLHSLESTYNENDPKPCVYFSPNHSLISENAKLNELSRILVELSHYKLGHEFINVITSNSLKFTKQICDQKLFQESINIGPELLSLTLKFFIIDLLILCDHNKVAMALDNVDGFRILSNSPVFNIQSNLWSSTPENNVLNLYSILKKSLFQMMNVIAVDCPKYAVTIFGLVSQLLDQSPPEIFDDVISFAINLFKMDPKRFINILSNTNFLSVLIRSMYTLQNCHISMDDNDKYKVFYAKISLARTNALTFLDTLIRIECSKYYLFSQEEFVAFVFHLLFENPVQDFAISCLTKGLYLESSKFSSAQSQCPTDFIFLNLVKMFRTATYNINNEIYYTLMITILKLLKDAFTTNKKSLIGPAETYNYMSEVTMLSKNVKDFKKRRAMTNLILETFIPLTFDNPRMRSLLVKTPMKNITESLVDQKVKKETVDLLLQLICEIPVVDMSCTTNIEIKNQKLIPYLHEIIKHLPVHYKVFQFIYLIVENSVTNKLQVYKSKLPITILQYISSFDSEMAITDQQQMSIDVLVKLFSAVSVFAFKWKTLVELIKILQPKNDMRMWFTDLMVTNISTILSTITSKTPQSFISFHGKHSGLFLPRIPTHFINRGFTLLLRLELSSDYLQGGNHQPRLFSMKNINGKTLEIYFEDNRLVVTYNAMKTLGIHETTIELSPHTWYHIAVSLERRLLKLYVLGNLCDTYEITGMKFESDIESMTIGNTILSELKYEEPLIANLSCMYMFSTALSADTIKMMSDLPLDFVYGFHPTLQKLFPNLPPSLFTEQISDSMFACYNSRFALNNICVNNSKKDIGNAKVIGDVYSFSTSLCDVLLNIGGLKTFLPLFSQVELPVFDQYEQDQSKFLVHLIEMVVNFCNTSPELQIDFFEDDGLKCISFLLSKMNPETITEKLIINLQKLFDKLSNKKYIKLMIEDIWFNYFLIGLQTPAIKLCFIKVWSDLIHGAYSKLVSEVVNVCRLMLFTISEKDENVRKLLWKVIRSASETKLTWEDKEMFFNLCFSLNIPQMRIELMYVLYDLCVKNYHQICDKFVAFGFYTPFVTMMSNDSEELRIIAFKFMLLVKTLEDTGVITRQNSICFEDSFLKVIYVYNPDNITENTWAVATQAFLDSPSYQTALIPFISFISQFYKWSRIEKFFSTIDQNTMTVTSPILQSFSRCEIWYFWIFYTMVNASYPEYNVNNNSVFLAIYSKVLIYFIKKQYWDKFYEFEAFFIDLQKTVKLNTPCILKFVYHKLLKLLQLFPNVSADEVNFVFTEIFEYLFYIPDTEIYHNNVSLIYLMGENVEDPLTSVLDSQTPCMDILSQICSASMTHKVNFSVRIDPRRGGTLPLSGGAQTNPVKWLDLKVARQLIGFMTKNANLRDGMYKVQNRKIKYSEMISFMLGFIIQSSPSKITKISSFLKALDIDQETNFQLFAYCAISAIRTYQKDASCRKQVNDLLMGCKSLISKVILNGQPLEVQNILEDYDIMSKIFEATKDAIANLEQTLEENKMDVSKQLYLDQVYYKSKKTREIIVQTPHFLQENVLENVLRKKEEFKQQIISHSISCMKSHANVFKDLKSNGGPWSTTGEIDHWKVSKELDDQYRQVFFRPNLKFDIHMKASLMRDGTTAEAAQNKYERWLDANKIHIGNEDEEVSQQEDEETTETTEHRDFAFFTVAQMITIKKTFEGTFYVNKNELSFNDDNKKSVTIKLSDLKMVLHRSFLHIDSGLEFFMKNNKSVFIYFPKGDRNRVLKHLKHSKLHDIEILQYKNNIREWIDKATYEWQKGLLSNYEYLMKINLFAGRSFNDLSQYPIFPWVLSNYTSETIDLNDPKNYRDFTKPVGAFNQQRLESLLELLQEYEDDAVDKCLYRFHYSTAFYVVHFLVRVEPYTSIHIELQDNMFDNPNRTFRSIPFCWKNVTSTSPDFRELIPQFFSLPEMLINQNNFDLGSTQDGSQVNDVELPPWANSAAEFIQINRNALESKYVSENLNDWIDLIFGYKQTGNQAVLANNTFHKYCYASSVTKEVLKNPDQLKTIQIYASNSGIVPRQIFNYPHPKRIYTKQMSVTRLMLLGTKLCWNVLMKFKSPVVFIGQSTNCIPILTAQSDFMSIPLSSKWRNSVQDNSIKQVQLATIKKYVTLPDTEHNFFAITSRSFEYIQSSGLFVASSPWDSTFHVFKVESNSAHYLYSQRQNSSLISGVTGAHKKGMIVTRWQDSSISVWDVEKPQQNCLLYRIQPNLTSLVDVDVCSNLNCIVSLDKARTVIITKLSSGHYLRHFAIEGNDTLKNLLVLSAGYIVIASEYSLNGRLTTTLRCYTFNAIFLKSFSYESALSCLAGIKADTCPMLAVSFSDGHFSLIDIPQMVEIISTKKFTMTNIVYNDEYNCLFASDSSGNLLYLDL